MKLTVNLDSRLSGQLRMETEAGVKKYPVSNRLKTLREGTRKSSEVVTTIPDKLPYDPQPFPRGAWKINGVLWQKDKKFDYHTYGPVKIMTDAWQKVETWELDEEGDYLKPSGSRVLDTCYWLHYSGYNTTLGCIRLASPADAEEIGRAVEAALRGGEAVELEVA